MFFRWMVKTTRKTTVCNESQNVTKRSNVIIPDSRCLTYSQSLDVEISMSFNQIQTIIAQINATPSSLALTKLIQTCCSLKEIKPETEVRLVWDAIDQRRRYFKEEKYIAKMTVAARGEYLLHPKLKKYAEDLQAQVLREIDSPSNSEMAELIKVSQFGIDIKDLDAALYKVSIYFKKHNDITWQYNTAVYSLYCELNDRLRNSLVSYYENQIPGLSQNALQEHVVLLKQKIRVGIEQLGACSEYECALDLCLGLCRRAQRLASPTLILSGSVSPRGTEEPHTLTNMPFPST